MQTRAPLPRMQSLESVQAQLKDVATTFVDVQQDERVRGVWGDGGSVSSRVALSP